MFSKVLIALIAAETAALNLRRNVSSGPTALSQMNKFDGWTTSEGGCVTQNKSGQNVRYIRSFYDLGINLEECKTTCKNTSPCVAFTYAIQKVAIGKYNKICNLHIPTGSVTKASEVDFTEVPENAEINLSTKIEDDETIVGKTESGDDFKVTCYVKNLPDNEKEQLDNIARQSDNLVDTNEVTVEKLDVCKGYDKTEVPYEYPKNSRKFTSTTCEEIRNLRFDIQQDLCESTVGSETCSQCGRCTLRCEHNTKWKTPIDITKTSLLRRLEQVINKLNEESAGIVVRRMNDFCGNRCQKNGPSCAPKSDTLVESCRWICKPVTCGDGFIWNEDFGTCDEEGDAVSLDSMDCPTITDEAKCNDFELCEYVGGGCVDIEVDWRGERV